MAEEMLGDGSEEQKMQFEPCKYRTQDKEKGHDDRGFDGKCKYMNNYNNCIFENCVMEQEETPPTVDQWWYTCVICHAPDSIDPRQMKIHWCNSCISRANEAEILPFTCRYCGARQNHPSQWFMSRVCDACIDQLYNKNCKNYWCNGCHC